MKVKATEIKPYPGYEEHLKNSIQTDEENSGFDLSAKLNRYTLGLGTVMEDIYIPGSEKEIMLHIIRPAELPEKAPVVMDIHGGFFIAGNTKIDNYRNIYIAEHTPCIVVSVEYQLATQEIHFPTPLMDCYAAYSWLRANAAQIGGDENRIGVHGTSAGGALAAGLSLYLRDKNEQQPALNVLVCPTVDMKTTRSKLQYGNPERGKTYAEQGYAIYTGLNGETPNYYALPGVCRDYSGLGPHMIITAEYDALRDEGMEYANNLLRDGVPCEMICAPRVGHGFCVMDRPLTHWVHDGICASFRREFGMQIIE